MAVSSHDTAIATNRRTVPPLPEQVGLPIAAKAMAVKLAQLVYRMLRYEMKYVDRGANFSMKREM